MFSGQHCQSCYSDHLPSDCPNCPPTVIIPPPGIAWTAEQIQQMFQMVDEATSTKEPPMRTAELPRLLKIAERLARFVAQRDAHYKASWKRRGGPGAYFTMVRPIDRFEAIAERGVPSSHDPTYRNRNLPETTNSHDVFTIWEHEDNSGELFKDGTLSACVQDIFAYMLLLMEEMDARKAADSYQAQPVAGREVVEVPHPDKATKDELRLSIARLESERNGLQEALDNANLVISKQREQLADQPAGPAVADLRSGYHQSVTSRPND